MIVTQMYTMQKGKSYVVNDLQTVKDKLGLDFAAVGLYITDGPNSSVSVQVRPKDKTTQEGIQVSEHTIEELYEDGKIELKE